MESILSALAGCLPCSLLSLLQLVIMASFSWQLCMLSVTPNNWIVIFKAMVSSGNVLAVLVTRPSPTVSTSQHFLSLFPHLKR